SLRFSSTRGLLDSAANRPYLLTGFRAPRNRANLKHSSKPKAFANLADYFQSAFRHPIQLLTGIARRPAPCRRAHASYNVAWEDRGGSEPPHDPAAGIGFRT
ncbi:MAG: hypothetical protein ACLQU1_25905, partial [Bryobacteraceae bacterium]